MKKKKKPPFVRNLFLKEHKLIFLLPFKLFKLQKEMAFFNSKGTQTESEIIVFSHTCTQTEKVVVPSETVNTELKEDTEEVAELQFEDAPSGSSRSIGDYASGGQPEDLHNICGRSKKISKTRSTSRLWQRISKSLLFTDMKRTKYMNIKCTSKFNGLQI